MITIIRHTFTTLTAIGTFNIFGWECSTLEDVPRALGIKIYGRTAIPEGDYKLKFTMSNRFKRVLPLIYNQDDYTINDGRGVVFKGVRMHAGNTHEDTHGCILPGLVPGENAVYSSRLAMDKIKALLGTSKIYDLSIINKQA